VEPAPAVIQRAATAWAYGSADTGVPVSWRYSSASTRAAVCRDAVCAGPKLVALRGAIQPAATIQSAGPRAPKPAGRSVSVPAWAGAANAGRHSTATASAVRRPLILRHKSAGAGASFSKQHDRQGEPRYLVPPRGTRYPVRSAQATASTQSSYREK